MKKAFFITKENLRPISYDQPWHNKGQICDGRKYNLPDMGGILTFRRVFKCEKKLDKAIVRASALGVFEMYLNGARVGEKTDHGTVYDELKPGWTDYRIRVFEFIYEITDMIEKSNVFIASVSGGWWNGRISDGFYGYKQPAFCAEIELFYSDGSSDIIASDENFETAVAGPVRYADIWDGEYYDATKEDELKHGDIWEKAVKYTDFDGKITEISGPRVMVREALSRRPLSSVVYKGHDEDGSYFGRIHILSENSGENCEHLILRAGESIVLDMGQNMVGRPKITVRAPKGAKIIGYFAEALNDSGEKSRGNDGPRGSAYIQNYRSALSRMTYIAAGRDTETYRPLFTFFGFRYLELTCDADIEIFDVVGEVVGSEMEETGSIITSNAEVNKLISNIMWGQRSNYLSVPTDCPQRDERLGWTGDTQMFCGAGAYQMNIDGFMKKWLQDARDSQIGYDGAYDIVIPRIWNGKGCSGAWTDAGIIVPYKMYLMYADKKLIEEHYDSMESYMSVVAKNGLAGPFANFGDWLAYDLTGREYISVCCYVYDARIMEYLSEAIGKKERAEYYSKLKSQITDHFKEIYVKDDQLTLDTQTAYLLALGYVGVEGRLRENCIRSLKDKIVANDYTLSTGFIGTGILNQTLSDVGLDGLCYSLLLQTKDPSWIYSVRQGATTVWERWNSYTLENGFGKVSMNSFNHYAYGAVAEWMYSKMAGISPDPKNPGFKHFILCPRPDTRKAEEIPDGQSLIKSVKASYKSISGLIRSEWEYNDGEFAYFAEIPEGAEATVEFPMISGRNFVTLNGVKMSDEEINAKRKNGKIIFDLSAGTYSIR